LESSVPITNKNYQILIRLHCEPITGLVNNHKICNYTFGHNAELMIFWATICGGDFYWYVCKNLEPDGWLVWINTKSKKRSNRCEVKYLVVLLSSQTKKCIFW